MIKRCRSTSHTATQYNIYTKASNTYPSDVHPRSQTSEASRQVSTLVSHPPDLVSQIPLVRVEQLFLRHARKSPTHMMMSLGPEERIQSYRLRLVPFSHGEWKPSEHIVGRMSKTTSQHLQILLTCYLNLRFVHVTRKLLISGRLLT